MVQRNKKDFRGLLPHPTEHCMGCSAVGWGLPDQQFQANYFCSTILSPDTSITDFLLELWSSPGEKMWRGGYFYSECLEITSFCTTSYL